MLNILLVTDSYLPTISGVTTVVSQYAKELKKLDHSIKILAPFHKGASPSPDVIPVTGLDNPIRPDTTIPLQFFKLRKQIDAYKPDVVHIHTPGILGLWARSWAMRHDIKIVTTVHGVPGFMIQYLPFHTYYSDHLQNLGWKYWKWFLKSSDVILAPSFFMVEQLEKHGLQSKVQRLPFWIDEIPRNLSTKKRQNTKTKPTHFLFFGRLDPDKNLDFLIKAWSTMADADKKLTIFGRDLGGRKRHLLKLAKSLGCQDSVRILANYSKTQKLKLYAETDFLIMPSHTETQSIIALEATFAGIPLLAVNAGALPEIVQHSSQPQLLYEPNNMKSFAEKVTDCCNNKTNYTKNFTLKSAFKKSFSKEHVLAKLTKEVYSFTSR